MLETLLVAFGIFLIRIIGNAISTLRLVMLARDRDGIVFILSFLESLTFAVAIGAVVTNLDSLLNLIAYSAGYAIGNSLGVLIPPDAFITTRTLQSTRRGFIPAVRPGLNRVLNRSR
jgi:uncharacterized protein YebE (UPF0316 family)